MDVSYGEAYRMNRVEARRRLVQTFTQTRSLAATARQRHPRTSDLAD